MERVFALRKKLNGCARLSGDEKDTVDLIESFLSENTSLEIHNEGNRLWAVHREPHAKETIAFRADVDAIPGEVVYHGCGHDGHSAILAGMALQCEGRILGKNIMFLFQNSEETGEGASQFCERILSEAVVSRIYGLHNLPGYRKGVVFARKGTFACASRGFVAEVSGKQSHAAYPEQGRNPAVVISETILELNQLAKKLMNEDNGTILMATVINIQVGDENFGVSPGNGRLCLTLRSSRDTLLDEYQMEIQKLMCQKCEESEMTVAFRTQDSFPDTSSDAQILEAALDRWDKNGVRWEMLREPMRWSEDFGWYLKRIPGTFFGIGMGEDASGLHTPEYQFDDSIIPNAISAFLALI